MNTKYEVRGLGPYLIYDKEKDKCVSMISFQLRVDAEAFIKKLMLSKQGEKK